MICDPCKAAGMWLGAGESWIVEGPDRVKMRMASLHAECTGCDCQHIATSSSINRDLVDIPKPDSL
jgi:hypothetical protein